MLSDKPWNAGRTLRWLFTALAGGASILLVLALVGRLTGDPKLEKSPELQTLMGILGLHGAILLATGYVLGSERIPWSEAFGWRRGDAGRALRWGAGMGLALLPLSALLQGLSTVLLKWLHVTLTEEQAVQNLKDAHSVAGQLLMVAFAVVIAPVAEEILFRGVLYPTVRQAGYPRLAWWGTAVLFGAIHGNAGVFLPLTALAWVLTWLYNRTDNLLAPITAHAVFNSCNVVLLLLNERYHFADP